MNGSLGGAVFNVLLPVEQATTASLP
jgi:hypothetical protein